MKLYTKIVLLAACGAGLGVFSAHAMEGERRAQKDEDLVEAWRPGSCNMHNEEWHTRNPTDAGEEKLVGVREDYLQKYRRSDPTARAVQDMMLKHFARSQQRAQQHAAGPTDYDELADSTLTNYFQDNQNASSANIAAMKYCNANLPNSMALAMYYDLVDAHAIIGRHSNRQSELSSPREVTEGDSKDGEAQNEAQQQAYIRQNPIAFVTQEKMLSMFAQRRSQCETAPTQQSASFGRVKQYNDGAQRTLRHLFVTSHNDIALNLSEDSIGVIEYCNTRIPREMTLQLYYRLVDAYKTIEALNNPGRRPAAPCAGQGDGRSPLPSPSPSSSNKYISPRSAIFGGLGLFTAATVAFLRCTRAGLATCDWFSHASKWKQGGAIAGVIAGAGLAVTCGWLGWQVWNAPQVRRSNRVCGSDGRQPQRDC